MKEIEVQGQRSMKETLESDQLSEWYNKVIKEAGLVDQGLARGTIVLRPYGFALWKGIQSYLGNSIQEKGVEDAYFPAIVPEKFLTKEKEHIKGFAPEFLRVQGRGGIIGVLRPTSEAVMYPLFSKWIKSYKDLPLKINQWCNIFRDELRTYAFMRTSEFLWQEGHCAFANSEENEEAVMDYLEMYKDTFEKLLAVSPVFGKKSEKEKFAGAFYTTTGEAMMPNGKALQVCTSHNLGTNFSKAYDIQYLDKDGKRKYVYQTSWGFSWRAIGAMILTHGDKKGLILPPNIAPIQIVVIPIRDGKADVEKSAKDIKDRLNSFRVKVDLTDDRPGQLYYKNELKGIPLRIEIGPRDLVNDQVILVDRLTGEKENVSNDDLKEKVTEKLDLIQRGLLERSKKLVEDNTHDVDSWQEFTQLLKGEQGFLRTYHCGDRKCEELIQEETKATLRCIPYGYEQTEGICIKCGKKSIYGQKVLFAKAY